MEKKRKTEIINKGLKRLSVDMEPKIHREIKTRSSYCGMTISQWIMGAITQRFIEEDKYLAKGN